MLIMWLSQHLSHCTGCENGDKAGLGQRKESLSLFHIISTILVIKHIIHILITNGFNTRILGLPSNQSAICKFLCYSCYR